MFELSLHNGYCCVCTDQNCLRHNSIAYHKQYHGSRVYRVREAAWQIWRPRLREAAEKSLRSMQRIRATQEHNAQYLKEVQDRIALIQKEPLVDAMLKSQGQ